MSCTALSPDDSCLARLRESSIVGSEKRVVPEKAGRGKWLGTVGSVYDVSIGEGSHPICDESSKVLNFSYGIPYRLGGLIHVMRNLVDTGSGIIVSMR